MALSATNLRLYSWFHRLVHKKVAFVPTAVPAVFTEVENVALEYSGRSWSLEIARAKRAGYFVTAFVCDESSEFVEH